MFDRNQQSATYKLIAGFCCHCFYKFNLIAVDILTVTFGNNTINRIHLSFIPTVLILSCSHY